MLGRMFVLIKQMVLNANNHMHHC